MITMKKKWNSCQNARITAQWIICSACSGVKIIIAYNVIFIDECTLISESQKQIIFDRYPNIKIIFLGDPGYQLDGFSVDKNVKFIPFTTEKFENIVLYDKNYRVKCNVLAEHLINIRN